MKFKRFADTTMTNNEKGMTSVKLRFLSKPKISFPYAIAIAEANAMRVEGRMALALIHGMKIPIRKSPPKGAVKQLKLRGIISTIFRF